MTAPLSIPGELWAIFPPAAQAIIVSLLQRNAVLEVQVAQLEAEVADLKGAVEPQIVELVASVVPLAAGQVGPSRTGAKQTVRGC